VSAPLAQQVENDLVRRALEISFIVAREGARRQPPIPAPPSLRPFLRFQGLPDRVLGPVRRALDADEAFRERVAAAVTEETAGPAGVLLVHRPEGWEAELAALVDAEVTKRETAAGAREERTAQRRLAQLEERLHKAEADARAARSEASAAADAVAEARLRRREAEERIATLEARLAAVEAERNLARRDAGARAAERDAARADIERLAAELAAATDAPVALSRSLRDAADTARHLADTLDRAATYEPPTTGRGGAAPRMRAGGTPSAAGGTAGAAPRRVPAALPPAMFDDSVEAAEHLVRVPGALLIVDGYNATLSASPWSELALAEQRQRLVDALSELAARTQVAVEVVFDGSDVGPAPVPRAGRQLVRVLFTTADVEADDVVVDRARTTPIARVIVIASSDRRVQDGARAAGANVISAAQLMAVLRTTTR
jgi:predicted RNA-binding protein with PIN domain